MSFHDSLFPVDIALDSEGGPERRTDIISLQSGHEERNSPWAASRRRFNAGYGIKSIDDIEAVIAFFEARHGRLYGFRFRDPFDHKSCPVTHAPQASDQLIAKGDGASVQFQLIKTYLEGVGHYQRVITKPVTASVRVAVDGELLEEQNDFTVNVTTGKVILAVPPAEGACRCR